jgi:hypothetical protein
MKAMPQIVTKRWPAGRVEAEAEAGLREEDTSKQNVRASIPMPREGQGKAKGPRGALAMW